MPDLELYFTIQKKANTNEKQTIFIFIAIKKNDHFSKSCTAYSFMKTIKVHSHVRQKRLLLLRVCISSSSSLRLAL